MIECFLKKPKIEMTIQQFSDNWPVSWEQKNKAEQRIKIRSIDMIFIHGQSDQNSRS